MKRISAAGNILVGYVLLAAMIVATGTFSANGTAYAAVKSPSNDAVKLLDKLSGALSEIADGVKPAVVNISTTSTVTMQEEPFGDMFNDPFFRRFFGDQFDHGGRKQKFKSSALGSGVIVSENGYILTNFHVIKGADEIKVLLSDKREFAGKVIGSDPRTDLAVIKINAKDLPVLRFGDSSLLKVGDLVLAVGNPFGLNQTVTMGIVSAVGRSNIGLADFEDFIQTDAAINPGNSGGALVNSEGHLVGINTAIFSTSGGYMGVGFAIPSDMAKSVMDSIIKHGKVIRGWLGVSIQSLTPELAKQFDLKGDKGALVTEVFKGGPAEKSGLKRGDLIVALDGKAVNDSTNLRNMVAEKAPSTTVQIGIVRDGKESTIAVTLGEFQEKKAVKASVERNNALKGVTVQDIGSDLRGKLDLPDDVAGVAVVNVAAGSFAEGVLAKNDVIIQVNRKDVKNADEFDRIASSLESKDTVLLLIYRGGGYLYLTIRP